MHIYLYRASSLCIVLHMDRSVNRHQNICKPQNIRKAIDRETKKNIGVGTLLSDCWVAEYVLCTLHSWKCLAKMDHVTKNKPTTILK